MCCAFYFHGTWLRLFECLLGLHSPLTVSSRWIKVSSLSRTFGKQKQQRSDEKLGWSGMDPKHEIRFGRAQQSSPTSNALLLPQNEIRRALKAIWARTRKHKYSKFQTKTLLLIPSSAFINHTFMFFKLLFLKRNPNERWKRKYLEKNAPQKSNVVSLWLYGWAQKMMSCLVYNNFIKWNVEVELNTRAVIQSAPNSAFADSRLQPAHRIMGCGSRPVWAVKPFYLGDLAIRVVITIQFRNQMHIQIASKISRKSRVFGCLWRAPASEYMVFQMNWADSLRGGWEIINLPRFRQAIRVKTRYFLGGDKQIDLEWTRNTHP